MNNKSLKPLAITPGEPAGIGPDIVVQLANQDALSNCVVISDPDLLEQRARQLGLSIKISCFESRRPFKGISSGLAVLPIRLTAPCIPGKIDVLNAAYVLKTLEVAAKACLNNQFAGVVTGPVNKSVINDAGVMFTGHTEFFAEIAGVSDVVMMFIGDPLKVALATVHMPLSKVVSRITQPLLEKTIHILWSELRTKLGLSDRRILVCGLNPHAGEKGYLGQEEIEIIIPVINKLKMQGINVEGPFPADTVFSLKLLRETDVILAMYHDQGLPVLKYAAFGQAVNVTLGLPFIRTSVDHGTALDLAGTGKADVGSFKAAIKCAWEMASL